MASTKRSVLSDRYLLGEELGRGAYGNVFKGTDLVTNEAVAIKQISLTGMSQDNLQGVMGEIELLKTLNHANIVKYIGSFKTRTHLYIILEYMENGALSAIIKPNRFGVFPETLVAVYIAQVLKGLQYLHEQGVVHRDIKGANILTTKEGLVKLADFGVAAKLGELEDRRDELQQHVVGTPYWMAPEVIEMTQVTPASDIWSVGCLIVELLTGSPPYYDLQPMSALFRIVQDDCPPLPDNTTPLMQDFLLRCFQKDPRKRPGAQDLLQHDWIHMHKTTLRSSWRRNHNTLTGKAGRPSSDHESVTSVISRMVALDDSGADSATGMPYAASTAPATPQPSPAPAAVPASGQVTPPRLPPPPGDPPLGANRVSPTPLRDGAVSSPAIPSPILSPADVTISTGTPSQPAQPLIPGPLAAGATASAPTTLQYPQSSSTSPVQQQQQQQDGGGQWQQGGPQHPPNTITGPITSLVSMLGGPPHPAGGQLGPWLQDADRMVTASGPKQGVHSMMSSMSLERTGGGYGDTGQGAGMDVLGPTANSMMLDLRRQVRELVRVLRPVGSASRDHTPMSPAAACHALASLVSSSPDAKQFMMTETGALVVLELLDTDNPKYVEGAMELLLAITHDDLVTLETICLLGVVPAAAKYALPPYPASLRLRTAAFLARFFNSGPSTLAHFVACQGLKQLVAMVADLNPPKTAAMSTTTPAPYSTPSSYQPPHPVSTSPPTPPENPGLPLSQVAISCIFNFLDCYNILPHNYLCRLLAQNGLVPRLFVVIRETHVQLSRPASTNLNSAANTAGRTGTGSTPTWHSAATPFDPKQAQKGMSPAWSNTPAVRPPGQTVDTRSLKAGGLTGPGKDEEPAPLVVPQLTHEELAALQEAAVSLLLLLSNADPLVKGFCCTRENLQHHLDCLNKLQPPSLIRLMRALRWLSGELACLPAIKDAGAISVLVPFLSKDRVELGGVAAAQVQLEALHALYNICKFNKMHLETAASVGITHHLCQIAADGITALRNRALGGSAKTPDASRADQSTPRSTVTRAGGSGGTGQPEDELLDPVARWGRLRGFVVPLLVALVGTSSSTRAKLWAANGPDIFLTLLSDQESVELGVASALDTWLCEDHARMEPRLTERQPVKQIVDLYARVAQSQDTAVVPALLSVLRSMIGRSSKLAVAVALGPGGIVPSLLALIDNAAPILRVKILEILRCLYEHYPRPKEFLLAHSIPDVLRRLLESSGRGADAVHQEAQRLLTAFQINVLM